MISATILQGRKYLKNLPFKTWSFPNNLQKKLLKTGLKASSVGEARLLEAAFPILQSRKHDKSEGTKTRRMAGFEPNKRHNSSQIPHQLAQLNTDSTPTCTAHSKELLT